MNVLLSPIWKSLRTQLILVFLILMGVAAGFVLFQILPAWRTDLEDNIREEETHFVDQQRVQVEDFLVGLDQDIRFLSQLGSVESLAQVVVQPQPDPVALSQLRTAVTDDFFAFADSRRIYSQVRFLNASGVEVVRINFDGNTVSVHPINQLQNNSDRDYFVGTAALPANEVFVSRFDLSREGFAVDIVGTLTDNTVVPTLRYGVPIYTTDVDGATVLAGIVITNVFADSLLDLLQPSADDAALFLIDNQGYYLKNSDNPALSFGFEPDIESVGGTSGARIQDRFSEEVITALWVAEGVDDHTTDDDQLIHFTRISPPNAQYYWVLGSIRDEAALFEPIGDTTESVLRSGAIFLGVLAVIGMIAIAVGMRPLNGLARVANQAATGDLSVRAKYDDRPDEIGTLSRSFNTMTSELDTSLKTLERRVEMATRDLQTLIDVNLQTVDLLDSERLLHAVANLATDRFGLYHAQFYVRDGAQLRLVAGAGFVGRQMLAQQHTISLDNARSIVAKTARIQNRLLIEDTTTSADFLPNPLLPETVSELALPLIARGQFIGILDLQSNRRDVFNERFIAILEVLALQVSNALLNAQLFETVARESRHDLALSQITSAVQQANSIDDVLKTAARELGRALRVPHTVIEVQLKDLDS